MSTTICHMSRHERVINKPLRKGETSDINVSPEELVDSMMRMWMRMLLSCDINEFVQVFLPLSLFLSLSPSHSLVLVLFFKQTYNNEIKFSFNIFKWNIKVNSPSVKNI
jgi:hypothetical protein